MKLIFLLFFIGISYSQDDDSSMFFPNDWQPMSEGGINRLEIVLQGIWRVGTESLSNFDKGKYKYLEDFYGYFDCNKKEISSYRFVRDFLLNQNVEDIKIKTAEMNSVRKARATLVFEDYNMELEFIEAASPGFILRYGKVENCTQMWRYRKRPKCKSRKQ